MAQQNVSTMNIQLTMQGQQAEQGLNRVGALVDDLKGKFELLSTGIAGLAIVQLGKKMLETVSSFNEFLKTSQKLTIELGAAAGNISAGSVALAALNKVSLSTLVGVESLSKGFVSLANSGIGLTDSLDVLGKAAEMDWAFGGEGKGAESIASAIGGMNKNLVATADAFELLKSKGVNAYASLGKVIGKTAEEAESLLKAGKVTGFQGTQGLMQSLNSREAKAIQREGTVGLLPSDYLNPMNWGKLTSQTGKFVLDELSGAPGQMKGAANKNAEYLKALNAHMEQVSNSIKNDLANPVSKLLDNLSILDEELKLTSGRANLNDAAKLLKDKKQQLVDSFVQIPLSAYESLGKQAQDVRDQIKIATEGKQVELVSRLEERLKGLMPEASTAGGPMDAVAERLQKLRAQYDKASGKFGGPELSAKFYQDQNEILKQFALNDNSPFDTLRKTLEDLDNAAKRLRDPKLALAPDKYIEAREELAKREEQLVANYEKSVMEPVMTEGEKFAQAIANARLAIETATAKGDTAGGAAAEKKLLMMLREKANGVKVGGDVSQFFAGRAEAGSVDAWRTISKWQRSGMVSGATMEQKLVEAAKLQLAEDKKVVKELEEIKKIQQSKNPPPALVTIGWAGGPSKTKQ